MKDGELFDGWRDLYPLGRPARVTITVNRLDPTYYLQATSSFQLGEPFGFWNRVNDSFTFIGSHQQALGNVTNE